MAELLVESWVSVQHQEEREEHVTDDGVEGLATLKSHTLDYFGSVVATIEKQLITKYGYGNSSNDCKDMLVRQSMSCLARRISGSASSK